MGRQCPVLRSRHEMNRVGQGHTGVVHPSKVAEEVGQGIFQVLDTHLFPEIENRKRYNTDKHGKYCKVINRSRFEEYRDAV